MSQAMPNSVVSPSPEQEKPTYKPWQQQKGESMLWFNRFKRYRGLGPKRSLQAAVEQERGQITALKSTDEGQRQTGKRTRKNKASSVSHLSEVPKSKAVQVPGSWKQASTKWNWVERARAFDAWEIDHLFNSSMEIFIATDEIFTLPMDRINALQAMYTTMLTSYNKNNARMSFDQDCAYMGRMQSLLRDIREEMKLLDTEFVRAAARKRLERWQKDGTNLFAPKEQKK